MKGRWILLFALFCIVSITFGDYDIRWYNIDGGGGQSSGGPYELVGTVGH